jgi:type IV pilus assembly protein PilB
MEMDTQLRDMAFNKAPTNRIRDQAVASGMRTLLHDGVRKVLQGYTTIEEVLSTVAGDILAAAS